MANHDAATSHQFSSLELPRGAKPFRKRLIAGVGTAMLVECLEPNLWPEHSHVDHWHIVIVFDPGLCKVTWRRGRRGLARRTIEAGHVCIVPPGWIHSVQWCVKAPAVMLYVEAATAGALLAQANAEPVVASFYSFVSTNAKIAELCAELRSFDEVGTPVARWQMAGIGTQLAASMVEAHAKTLRVGVEPSMGLAERIVEKAKAQIAANITAKPPGEEFARSLGVSGRHLRRLFQRVTGKSLREFLVFARTKHAVRLLRSGSHNVKEAADAAGFSDNSHLNRCTQKYYSVSPSAFMPRARWPQRA